MSLDLFVACATMPTLPAVLPDPPSWKRYEYRGIVNFAHETATWQVVVSREDLDAGKLGAPRDKPLIISIVLEPGGAPNEGVSLLEKTAQAIVASCNGVLLEP